MLTRCMESSSTTEYTIQTTLALRISSCRAFSSWSWPVNVKYQLNYCDKDGSTHNYCDNDVCTHNYCDKDICTHNYCNKDTWTFVIKMFVLTTIVIQIFTLTNNIIKIFPLTIIVIKIFAFTTIVLKGQCCILWPLLLKITMPPANVEWVWR